MTTGDAAASSPHVEGRGTSPNEPTADALRLLQDPAAAIPPRLQRLCAQLSARDVAVLHDIAALQLMAARQVERLRFREGSPLTQARRARRTLERLHSLGLVTRLDRRIGGARAGSASYIYRLTPQGRHLLGLPGPHGGRRRGHAEPSHHRTDHILTVTELAVRLHEAHRTGELELVRFEAEPTSWRTYTGLAGEPHHLRPDAFVIIALGDWEHLWFIEVDLGTEHLRTIHQKANAYRDYARSGHEQTRWGIFPRVAFLATDPARCLAIGRTVLQSPEAHSLFTIARVTDATTALAHDDGNEWPASVDA